MYPHNPLKDSVVTGATSTLAVFSLPSALVDGFYKVIAAVITAILASVASYLVQRFMRKLTKKQDK